MSTQPHPPSTEIEGLVVELARDWFRGVVDGLTRADRRVTGGWPGTVSDARRLLVVRLAAISVALPGAELERLARSVYRSAKFRWLEIASRDDSATCS